MRHNVAQICWRKYDVTKIVKCFHVSLLNNNATIVKSHLCSFPRLYSFNCKEKHIPTWLIWLKGLHFISFKLKLKIFVNMYSASADFFINLIFMNVKNRLKDWRNFRWQNNKNLMSISNNVGFMKLSYFVEILL